MLRIQLLGSFQVSDDEKPVLRLQSDRLQALLAYLVLHRAAPLSRQQLAVTFWPDTTDAQARTNLRTLIARLREALPDVDQYIVFDSQTVQWRCAAPCVIDVIEFEQALGENRLSDAVALYRGDLLPACYDDWITGERERLRQAYQHALDQLITRSEKQGHFDQAIAYAQRLLRHDPLHETTYRHLMRLQLAGGDRSGALRTYHTCATMLRDELGVEPSRETRALYGQLLKVDEPAVEAALEPVRTSFVGRQPEWAQLLTTWHSASAGRPQLVLITGEAGIGKTHLAEYLLAHLNRQGVTPLTARCYATERHSAYGPISQWLRSEAIREQLHTLDQVWLVEVSRLAPWLHTDRPDLPTPGPLTEAWQRQRLFEALARAILIRQEPLLLLLDDVQWCDRETLDWLHYLLQFEPTAPLLIVGTVRQEEADDNETLSTLRLLLQKNDRLTEITLARFDADTTTRLVSSLSEHDVRDDEAARIYRETEGNPLFVVEMMRAGGRTLDQVSITPDQALPPKVQVTIQYRLSQLSAHAQSLIQVAAVIGREFTFEVLARVCDQSEDALVQGLDELWRKHVVREQGANAYDFSHDKIRAVAYAGLSTTRRRMLHHKVAEALVNVHTADLEAISAQIAQHYEIAGQSDRAIEFYRRAARAAQRVFANREAIELYQHAIEQAELLALNGDTAKLKFELYEAQGDVHTWLGQYEAARQAFQSALEDGTGSSPFQLARLLRKQGDMWVMQHEYDLAATAFDEAARLMGVSNDAWTTEEWLTWLDLQLNRIEALFFKQEYNTLRSKLQSIAPVVEQHGTPVQQANLLYNQAMIGVIDDHLTPTEIRIALMKAAVQAWQNIGHRGKVADLRGALGFLHLWRNELDEAEHHLLYALDEARQVGFAHLQIRCLTFLAVVYRKRSDVNQALAYASRSLELAQQTSALFYAGVDKSTLGWVAWRRGDFSQAKSLCEQALMTGFEGLPVLSLALAPLLGVALRDQQVAAAIGYARRMLAPGQPLLPGDVTRSFQQAIDAWDSGDPTPAQQFLEHATSLARSTGYL